MAEAKYLIWGLPIESKIIINKSGFFFFYFLGFVCLDDKNTRCSHITKISLSFRDGKAPTKTSNSGVIP